MGVEDRRAPQSMAAAGVPIVPGTTERVTDAARVVELGEEYGWPIAAQGVGRRRRQGPQGRAAAPDEAERALESAQREGQAYFADAAVYVEKYLRATRGTSRCRCSPTRTAPSSTSASATARCSAATRRSSRRRPRRPSTPELRERMGAMAVDAARAVGYVNAGTIECLLDRDGRLLLPRDEHAHPGRAHDHRGGHGHRPRARAAPGSPPAAAVVRAGRRRSCAATPSSAASTPRIRRPASCRRPAASRATASRPGRASASTRRWRRAARSSALYDPMVAKLVVWDRDRDAARRAHAAGARRVRGRGRADADPAAPADPGAPEFVARRDVRRPRRGRAGRGSSPPPRRPAPRRPTATRAARGSYAAEVDGRRFDVTRARARRRRGARGLRRRLAERRRGAGPRRAPDTSRSPMQGTVLQVEVAEGDAVAAGRGAGDRRGDEDGERDRRARPGRGRGRRRRRGRPGPLGQALLRLGADLRGRRL